MKIILRIAQAISLLFRPFYLPLIGVAAFFMFYLLDLHPVLLDITELLKIWTIVLVIIFLCTVVAPQFLIYLYHKTHGLNFLPFVGKEHRIVPYMISIACYFVCYWVLTFLISAPQTHMAKVILMAALVVQMACALINIKWKVSTHMAAIGSFLGGLIAFSIIYSFNPIWWFCIVNLIAGVVGTCRMILRQHTLGEVIGGYVVGFVGALLTILFV